MRDGWWALNRWIDAMYKQHTFSTSILKAYWRRSHAPGSCFQRPMPQEARAPRQRTNFDLTFSNICHAWWMVSVSLMDSCVAPLFILDIFSCYVVSSRVPTHHLFRKLCYRHSPPFSQALTSAVHVIVSVWMLLRALMLETSSAHGRWPQDGLKMTLRGSKIPPTCPQDGSNMFSRWAQDGATFVTHFSASLISQRSTRWLLWSLLLPLTTFLASTRSNTSCDCICYHFSIYSYMTDYTWLHCYTWLYD